MITNDLESFVKIIMIRLVRTFMRILMNPSKVLCVYMFQIIIFYENYALWVVMFFITIAINCLLMVIKTLY